MTIESPEMTPEHAQALKGIRREVGLSFGGSILDHIAIAIVFGSNFLHPKHEKKTDLKAAAFFYTTVLLSITALAFIVFGALSGKYYYCSPLIFFIMRISHKCKEYKFRINESKDDVAVASTYWLDNSDYFSEKFDGKVKTSEGKMEYREHYDYRYIGISISQFLTENKVEKRTTNAIGMLLTDLTKAEMTYIYKNTFPKIKEGVGNAAE